MTQSIIYLNEIQNITNTYDQNEMKTHLKIYANLQKDLKTCAPSSKLYNNSTFLTDGKTKGFPLSSLYAPTPKFILLGFVSLLNASLTPKIGSGGPISTDDQNELKTHP